VEFISDQLNDLLARNLYRQPATVSERHGTRVVVEGKELISFASNDYLGLSQHPDVIKAAVEATIRYGAGTASSRILQGTMEFHRSLERKLAQFKGCEDALIFPTGYMANIGVLSSLLDEDDVVISDELSHASIVDACRMTGATVVVYPHKNMERLNEALDEYSLIEKRIVLTDGLFSMDGDLAPLREITALAREHGAYTFVDDAHGTGVFGREGRGVIEHFDLKGQVDFITGTLSKAMGALGGFAAGRGDFIDFLRNRARSFIYTTAPPASVIVAAEKALDIIIASPELRGKLWDNVNYLTRQLRSAGIKPLCSESQIVPIMLGSAENAIAASKKLVDAGFFIPAIRPPTVPEGTARLRVNITAPHTHEDIDRLVEAIQTLGIEWPD
jgi:glycine C-acetyltransferase/8-amino-7-oxononanoate synthase